MTATEAPRILQQLNLLDIENRNRDDASVGTLIGNGCCQFTNYGPSGTITLWNTCTKNIMATVTSYDTNGSAFLTRTFHLLASGWRNILYPGYTNVISAEANWAPQGTDGGPSLTLTPHPQGSTVVWQASNVSNDFNAFQYGVYIDGQHKGTGQMILSPAGRQGTIEPVYQFMPEEHGSVLLDWAILDPE
jgi:hypothetical protein